MPEALSYLDLRLNSRIEQEYLVYNFYFSNVDTVGLRLQRLRQQYGLSRSDVVRQLQLRGLDICLKTYEKIENGQRRNISCWEAVNLCSVFNIPFSSLFAT